MQPGSFLQTANGRTSTKAAQIHSGRSATRLLSAAKRSHSAGTQFRKDHLIALERRGRSSATARGKCEEFARVKVFSLCFSAGPSRRQMAVRSRSNFATHPKPFQPYMKHAVLMRVHPSTTAMPRASARSVVRKNMTVLMRAIEEVCKVELDKDEQDPLSWLKQEKPSEETRMKVMRVIMKKQEEEIRKLKATTPTYAK